MGWGDQLWDQDAEVFAHVDKGADFLLRCKAFMQARSHLELAFARDLEKLVEKFKLDSSKPDIADDHSTLQVAWNTVLTETTHIAKQHEDMAEKFVAECADPLQELATEHKSGRKKAASDLAAAKKRLADVQSRYDSARKLYDKAYREYTDVSNKLKKLGEVGTNSKSKVDKLRHEKNRLHHETDATKGEYNLLRDELSKAQMSFYNQEQADILNSLEAQTHSRTKAHTNVLRTYAQIHEKALPVIGQCIAGMVESLDAVSANDDTELLANNYRTGNPMQTEVAEHDPSAGTAAPASTLQKMNARRVMRPKIFKSSRKKTAVREDFGHLPPEQRRKAILKKVSELQEEHTRVSKSMGAMSKTIEVYRQQPQFGDERALAKAQKEVDEYTKKQEQVAGELYKFQLYLCALQGTEPPTPPVGYKSEGSSTSLGDGADAISMASMSATSQQDRSLSVASRQHMQQQQQHHHGDTDASDEEDDYEDADDFEHGDDYGFEEQQQQQQAAEPQQPPTIAIGVALYPFPGANDGEMPVAEGERVHVLEDDGSGWARVFKNGQQGYVPRAYLRFEDATA
ncbi:hypothetical protein PTSG_01931 [Salpingoeca rosetta]|uniref:SH3 domain-containing protein n=1 Tax=Salpingoeca rosetta (strain ATCC 50818 / BSB-021) TaxID=946362 RepID=F2TZD3_SALR5|nr:uncharacterized protein PTSG_01931 [Salpingoeca rosetta]EGD78957.1 hypothetical protein PTSG_01931 [Salpingoeca rosetta]|eukprot:XP_004997913.1 hypothetical protein PTSG_01931 [Salpingoeca rosetta]